MQLDLAAWLGRARWCSCAAHQPEQGPHAKPKQAADYCAAHRQPKQLPHATPDTRSKQVADSCAAHCQPEQLPHATPDTRSKQVADSCAAHCQPEQLPHAKPDIEPNSCSDDCRTHAEPEQRADSRANTIAHTKPDSSAVSDDRRTHTLPDSRSDDRRTHAEPKWRSNDHRAVFDSDDRRTHPEPERSADSCADPIAHTKPDINAHDAVSDCTGGHILPDSRSDDHRAVFDSDDRRTHAEPEQRADSCAHAIALAEPHSTAVSDDRRTHPESERSADSCADPIAHIEPDINAHDAVSDCTGGHILPDSRSNDRRTHAEHEQLADDRHAVGSGSGAVRAVDCRQCNSRR
jgi:hypothetical protein